VTKPAHVIYHSAHLLASADLDAVDDAVAFYEETVGPLVEMKTDNDTTLLKFNGLLPEPQPFAKVAPQVDGKPVTPEGSTLVTTGQIFLSGVPTLCAATRGPEPE
jgi:hypothetical protein